MVWFLLAVPIGFALMIARLLQSLYRDFAAAQWRADLRGHKAVRLKGSDDALECRTIHR
jgi:TRAP-type C4-dicarboxylate transport system permease small subunit